MFNELLQYWLIIIEKMIMDLKCMCWVCCFEDGFYIIELNFNLNKQKLFCDICGIVVKCLIYEIRIKFDKVGVNFYLNSCIRYVLLFVFCKLIIGLDVFYFNIFCLGVMW